MRSRKKTPRRPRRSVSRSRRDVLRKAAYMAPVILASFCFPGVNAQTPSGCVPFPQPCVPNGSSPQGGP